MLPTDRIVYSAIRERPPLKLPDRARMACGRANGPGPGPALWCAGTCSCT
jgi:hypothetical protein